MLSMRNGIFANSLFGRGSCFERIAQCACRPKQLPRPQDSSKKPFGTAAPRVISEKQRHLLTMINRGCTCPKTDPKSRWFDVHKHIILSMAITLNRPPDVVLDFLYNLSMQNFRNILEPFRGYPAGPCNVPFANGNICTQYMSIFDTRGNVRNPFHRNSLAMLIRMMQNVLSNKQFRRHSPIDDFFVQPHPLRDRAAERAKRAGIDSSSAARQNGRRRLREADFKAQENRRILYNEMTDFLYHKPDVGSRFWEAVEPKTLQDFDLNDNEYGISSAFSTYQAEELTALIDLLNQRVLLTRHLDDLLEAIKSLKLVDPAVEKTVLSRVSAERIYVREISKSYNETVEAPSAKGNLKAHLSSIHRTLLSGHRPHGLTPRTHANLAKRPVTPKYKLYLGEQIPVLIHEPYDPKKPWTWMRRHPKQARLDLKANTLKDVNIRRYQSNSLKDRIEKSQETASVHTVFSIDEEDRLPMFGK